ncbi:MAG: hypothetical protein E5W44_17990 [Mesorhizobium sp.]|nr:MAG: hypothetical protein E5W44_17990 [Mesorhizobium sp.]
MITIAILIGIHQGADWLFSLLGVRFAVGFMAGAVVVLLIWYFEDRAERSRAAGGIPSAEQQRARHSIDL